MRLRRRKPDAGRQDDATTEGDAPGLAGPLADGAPAGVPGPGRQDGATTEGDAPGLVGPEGDGAPAGVPGPGRQDGHRVPGPGRQDGHRVPGPGRQDEHRVVVYSRDGCHLCEAAEQVVAQVVAETGDTWERVDVDADPELVARFHEQVPVTFVDGRQHDFWRVDAARLRAALAVRR